MARGVVDTSFAGGTALKVVNSSVTTRRITDQIDASYIANGDTAYWAFMQLAANGAMSFRLASTSDDFEDGGREGPQFTTTALSNLFIILFYGSTSAAWDGNELDNSDTTDPYSFSAASVTAAGPTNDSDLRSAISSDDTVTAMIVDASHPRIDINRLQLLGDIVSPTLSATPVGTDSATITWTTPPDGQTPTGYDLRYRQQGTTDWTERASVTSPYTITSLTAATCLLYTSPSPRDS